MSKTTEKKVLKKYFELIEKGEKTFELRLADWDCNPGDVLILIEIDDQTKEPTGRKMSKKVGYVGKTKEFDFWNEEEVQQHGYQIISLLDEVSE